LERAERIDPDGGEVHLQKGAYAYHGFRDYDRARSEFELARRLLPNSARLYLYLASVDRRQARWENATRNFDRATELDPLNFYIFEESAFTRMGLRRYAEASSLSARALALNPNDIFVRSVLWRVPFAERGETGPWRSHLAALLRDEREDASHVAASAFINCALAERNRSAAAQALTLIPSEGTLDPIDDFLWPRDWYVALVARSFGEADEAKRAFSAARTIAARTAQEQPDYAPAWKILGLIDAGLGDEADAIAEGKRACELLPISKDAWEGPSYVTSLALIYAWLGEKDRAFEQLTVSAKIPGGVTYGELKLLAAWDSLRDDARFDKIVASLAPKESGGQ
jgi:tetratricopeptide (TPR) repeat protein